MTAKLLVASTNQHPAEVEQNKVPEVTTYFWVIKVLCTTVGETFADFLSSNLGLGETWTGVVMAAVLVVALFFQFRVPRYVPGEQHLDHRTMQCDRARGRRAPGPIAVRADLRRPNWLFLLPK